MEDKELEKYKDTLFIKPKRVSFLDLTLILYRDENKELISDLQNYDTFVFDKLSYTDYSGYDSRLELRSFIYKIALHSRCYNLFKIVSMADGTDKTSEIIKDMYHTIIETGSNFMCKIRIYANDKSVNKIADDFKFEENEYIEYKFLKEELLGITVHLNNDARVSELLLYNNLED